MSDLQIAQKKMTNMLKVFHDICCELNIKYWCLGGTLIGAVRHSGFIPWDGDVDVAMLLDDYKILINYLQDKLPSTMYFFEGKIPGLVKIKDLYSSYVDKEDGITHKGLQIDIFTYKLVYINGGIKCVKSITPWLSDYKEDMYYYNDIFPVKTIKFDYFDVFVPNNLERICNYSYGGFPPPFPSVDKQICHEGRIDPLNPSQYYPIVFKDIYKKKTQQWFSEIANKDDTVHLHHMSGWNYINQEDWDNLCNDFLQGINLQKNGNLFDAGCGTGALFKYVKNINPEIKLYGCDINEDAIKKCRKLFPETNVTIDDITNLSIYETETFDNTVCVSTISYLQSLKEVKLAVNELLRITKPNGNLNICIMCDDIKGLKSFNIIIPKSLWSKKNLNVSEIKIFDIPFSKFTNRYSVFIKK
jgi:ubiquinone/menaquinone biosynthesis C-methylase UbiE